MAACRHSKVFSSDGSITASRFLPALGFPCNRCMFSPPNLRAIAVRLREPKTAPISETFNNREIKKAT
jgi:hypothetical protein